MNPSPSRELSGAFRGSSWRGRCDRRRAGGRGKCIVERGTWRRMHECLRAFWLVYEGVYQSSGIRARQLGHRAPKRFDQIGPWEPIPCPIPHFWLAVATSSRSLPSDNAQLSQSSWTSTTSTPSTTTATASSSGTNGYRSSDDSTHTSASIDGTKLIMAAGKRSSDFRECLRLFCDVHVL